MTDRPWTRTPLLALAMLAGLWAGPLLVVIGSAVLVARFAAVLRLAGDLLPGAFALRPWGGMLNAVAAVRSLALTVSGIVTSLRRPAALFAS